MTLEDQREAQRIAVEGHNYQTEEVGPLVYVASPYTQGDRSENVRVSIRTATELGDMGYAALSPLLNHLQDLMFPRSHNFWLSQDLAVIRACDVLLRLPGQSRGADIEEAHARKLGIPVVHSVEELKSKYPSYRMRGW